MINRLKNKILLLSFLVLIIIINLPYIYTFNNGFSNNSSDWSNYSSYISGLINPIISLIGIYLIFMEYTKSIKNRDEDKVLKRLEYVENDLTKVLQQNINYIAINDESTATLMQFLRYSKKQKFKSITILRGGMFVSTDLSFDIVKIFCYLNLLFIEINQLDASFQNYYELKYYDLLESLFSDLFYVENIRNKESISNNETYKTSATLLISKWEKIKKNYLTTAST